MFGSKNNGAVRQPVGPIRQCLFHASTRLACLGKRTEEAGGDPSPGRNRRYYRVVVPSLFFLPDPQSPAFPTKFDPSPSKRLRLLDRDWVSGLRRRGRERKSSPHAWLPPPRPSSLAAKSSSHRSTPAPFDAEGLLPSAAGFVWSGDPPRRDPFCCPLPLCPRAATVTVPRHCRRLTRIWGV